MQYQIIEMAMNKRLKELRKEVIRLLDEYGGIIRFDDENVACHIIQADKVDRVYLNDAGDGIAYLACDFGSSRYAEQVFPTVEEEIQILEWIKENY